MFSYLYNSNNLFKNIIDNSIGETYMFKQHFLIYVIFTLFSCSTVKAGPVDWDGAEKYITIQQKQFCDLKNNHVVDLYNAIDSRNEIKINKVKKQRQEDLDALLPSGKFENWIVKLVSIKQVKSPQDEKTDGDAAGVFELSCGSQIGSGSFLIDGKLTWGATIKYNSRQYREVSKLSSGQFAIISGTFLKLNDFAPSKKETFYASRPLTSKDLDNDKNSRYSNGDELFLSFISYIAAAN